MILTTVPTIFGPNPDFVDNSSVSAALTSPLSGLVLIGLAVFVAWWITSGWNEKARMSPELKVILDAIDSRYEAEAAADTRSEPAASGRTVRWRRTSATPDETFAVSLSAQSRDHERFLARADERSAARAKYMALHSHPLLSIVVWVVLLATAITGVAVFVVTQVAPAAASHARAVDRADARWTAQVSQWAHDKYGVTSGIQDWNTTDGFFGTRHIAQGNVIAQGHASYVHLVFIEGQPALMVKSGEGVELALVDDTK